MGGFLEEGLGAPFDLADEGSSALGLRNPGEALSDVSGLTAAEASREAARVQEALGREGLEAQSEARLRLEETLSPFVNFGLEGIGNYNQLFQGNVADSIAASPNVSGLLDLARPAIQQNPFLSGLDPAALEKSNFISGIDLLSRERSDILNQIALGQASAAQQAASGLQTGIDRADTLSQIGNVQASGAVGAANALSQGSQNLVGLGTAIASMFDG